MQISGICKYCGKSVTITPFTREVPFPYPTYTDAKSSRCEKAPSIDHMGYGYRFHALGSFKDYNKLCKHTSV